jgi:hypothetical protein
MKLNLRGAQRIAEDLMLDECQIWRDPQGTADDTWNPSTGTYAPPASDKAYLYFGKCGLSGNPGSVIQQGGQSLEQGQYNLSVPKDECPPLLPKDRVYVTISHQDPHLQGHTFIVDDVSMGTYIVTRRAKVHLLTPVPGSRG